MAPLCWADIIRSNDLLLAYLVNNLRARSRARTDTTGKPREMPADIAHPQRGRSGSRSPESLAERGCQRNPV